jgi:translation initiation factor IF-3
MALPDALKKAEEAGVDLVEIAPNAKPPVTKIIEFGKFKYREEKKLKKQKVKASDLKEVRFSPFIGDADYETRIARVTSFLKEKHKVKIVVKFLGRQMGSKTYGYKLTERILNEFGNTINIDMEPKFLGRHLTMVISPLSEVKIKQREKNEDQKDKA